MGVLRSLRDEVRQSRLFRHSVSISGTMTHSSQKSWIFSSRFARTLMFTARAGTALLSPDGPSIPVHSRIPCPFGLAAAALPNHSFVPARSDFR